MQPESCVERDTESDGCHAYLLHAYPVQLALGLVLLAELARQVVQHGATVTSLVVVVAGHLAGAAVAVVSVFVAAVFCNRKEGKCFI